MISKQLGRCENCHMTLSSWNRLWSESVSHSAVSNSVTPWTVAHQAPQSMEFSRWEYWSGLPFPSPGDIPDPGIKPGSAALQADSLLSEPPGKVPTLLIHKLAGMMEGSDQMALLSNCMFAIVGFIQWWVFLSYALQDFKQYGSAMFAPVGGSGKGLEKVLLWQGRLQRKTEKAATHRVSL